jgi:phospholipase D1/2
MDLANGTADLDGSGIPSPYRCFARDLRQQAWRRLLGTAADDFADVMDKPAAKECWQKMQALARANTAAYEAVFDFIPQSTLPVFTEDSGVVSGFSRKKKDDKDPDAIPASIWSVWDKKEATIDDAATKMPFSDEFWQNAQSRRFANKSELQKIKGYITQIPLRWTETENNFIPYNIRLFAQNTPTADDSVQIASVLPHNTDEGASS